MPADDAAITTILHEKRHAPSNNKPKQQKPTRPKPDGLSR